MTADLVATAIETALHGWEVGPLCKRDPHNPRRILHPHGKDPVGHLVPHGLLDFTSDIDTVARWWSQGVPWNIGVRIPASMFVLDIDGPDRLPHPGRGLQALAELEDRHGPLPATFTQITGSGGLHLFYPRPRGKLSRNRLPAGLEYKDHGGYVVWRQSVHPDTFEVYVGCDAPVAAPSAWLVDLIVDHPKTAPARAPRPSWSSQWLWHGPSIADQFSQTASWTDILAPHGWNPVKGDPDGDGGKWVHPTATSACSATVKNGCLFVYSPNTPFDVTEASNPKGYTKFRAFAVLNHGGDLKAAARALKGAAQQ